MTRTAYRQICEAEMRRQRERQFKREAFVLAVGKDRQEPEVDMVKRVLGIA